MVSSKFRTINLYFGGPARLLGGKGGKFGLKGRISHFSWAFEVNMSKWSLNSCETLNYIFFDQKFPSVIRICVDNWQIMHFETIFRPIPQL